MESEINKRLDQFFLYKKIDSVAIREYLLVEDIYKEVTYLIYKYLTNIHDEYRFGIIYSAIKSVELFSVDKNTFKQMLQTVFPTAVPQGKKSSHIRNSINKYERDTLFLQKEIKLEVKSHNEVYDEWNKAKARERLLIQELNNLKRK